MLKMKDTDRKTIKNWIDIWEKAGTSLQEIKFNEFRSDNYYQKNQQLLNEMLHYAFEHRTVRLSSGLIEQQKIFMKLYNQELE
ncbi:hypothetical protein AMJ80_07435 [bacterium SM23_31]|nr:MAG: hypothetical protein AMJ80_07435 [bacterium SM23_31]